ncbi:MAG: hypothetical protein HRU28_04130 [Rhizobiales bacterium]|nr:hypothetical protein [Hyphomicrobiales bacterium]
MDSIVIVALAAVVFVVVALKIQITNKKNRVRLVKDVVLNTRKATSKRLAAEVLLLFKELDRDKKIGITALSIAVGNRNSIVEAKLVSQTEGGGIPEILDNAILLNELNKIIK